MKKKNKLGEITVIYPAEKEVKKENVSKTNFSQRIKKQSSIDFFAESLVAAGILPKDYKNSSTYYFAKGLHKHDVVNAFQAGYGVAKDTEEYKWIITTDHYYIETFE